MASDVDHYCNIQQTQAGPLKLEVNSLANLFLSPKNSMSGIKVLTSCIFKGHLEITNNGKELVAYKIMTKINTKVSVRPSNGFIYPGETVPLKVSARNALDTNHNITRELSILILATTCTVIDEAVSTDLRLFWDSIVHDGSRSFVEILEINRFHFYDMNGSRLIAQQTSIDDSDINENSDVSLGAHLTNDSRNNYFDNSSVVESQLQLQLQSRCSSSSRFQQSDSNEEAVSAGDCSSQSSWVRKNSRAKLEGSIANMRKLSRNLVRTHRTLRNVRGCLCLFLFVIYLVFVQRNLRKIEVEIVVTTSKRSS